MSETLNEGLQRPDLKEHAQMMGALIELLEAQQQTNALLRQLIAATVQPESVTAVLNVEEHRETKAAMG